MDTENEEETGHNRGEKRPYAEVTQDDEGDWIWVLYAKNGKPVAVSMGEWERRNDCVNSLRATLKLLSAEEKPRILITHETA